MYVSDSKNATTPSNESDAKEANGTQCPQDPELREPIKKIGDAFVRWA